MPEPTLVCKDLNGNSHKVPISKLRWRPSAYGIVIKDGKLLTPKHFGKHNLPGGGLEFGETPEAAVIREIKEETGITVANPRLVFAYSNLFKMPYINDGTEFVQALLLYYACDFMGGDFSEVRFDEHEKLYSDMPEWCPLDKLPAITVVGSHDWREVVAQVVAKH